jgi:DNA-binding SARP family transcriptional activator
MPSVRIQLCGPLVVRLDGRDVSGELPGAQGRLLFGWLAVHRMREASRDELAELLWGEGRTPDAHATALRALLSKLRRALGDERLPASGAVRLRLAPDAWVDVEAARAAVHDAESGVALGDHERAWLAAHVAMNVAGRDFLAGHDHPWVDGVRHELEGLRLRALEALAACGLQLGGAELLTAARAAREVIAAAPLRETAHAALVDALTRAGNPADALLAYEQARRVLADELGTTPGPALRAAHERALGA